MSDDAKLHAREKDLLEAEVWSLLHAFAKHAVVLDKHHRAETHMMYNVILRWTYKMKIWVYFKREMWMLSNASNRRNADCSCPMRR